MVGECPILPILSSQFLTLITPDQSFFIKSHFTLSIILDSTHHFQVDGPPSGSHITEYHLYAAPTQMATALFLDV